MPSMTGSLTLRRWQAEAIPLGLEALESRVAGLVVATTGAGKSIFLAELLRRWRMVHPAAEGAVVVTTPSRALVEQLAGTLGGVLGSHVVGRYYTRAKQDRREVIVCCNASVPMLAARLREAGRPVAVWIADEAHKTEVEAFEGDEVEADGDVGAGAEVGDILRAGRRLGLTATPFRSDEQERLRFFDRVIYRYAPADALREGVIVPWRVVGWPENRDPVPVDDACVEMIQALGTREQRGPGVVNARTIADAEAYCARLAEGGLSALPIHSGLSRESQEANIARLRSGDVDCLVHVSMLVEGVDYPWLRWGCLRRPVQARVRFIQELGRYLRSNPGKTEAVILDPHDLFGVFDVTYEEALGWSDPKAEAAAKEEEEEREMREAKTPREQWTKRVTALSRYVRQLQMALVAEGVVASPTSTFPHGQWRDDPASDKQVQALRKMVRVTARLGRDHREALGRIADTDGLATKGLASDVFELCKGVHSLPGGEVWRPANPVPIPPDIAFQPVEDPCTYVAGAMKNGWSAVAIVRGGRELYAEARESRFGDRWLTLARSAMRLAVERHGATEIGSTLPDVVATVPPGVVGRLCRKGENPADGRAWAAIRRREQQAQEEAEAAQEPIPFGAE